jgi:hypothetical protein
MHLKTRWFVISSALPQMGQIASLAVSIFLGSRALQDWIRALDKSHAKKHTLDREWFR